MFLIFMGSLTGFLLACYIATSEQPKLSLEILVACYFILMTLHSTFLYLQTKKLKRDKRNLRKHINYMAEMSVKILDQNNELKIDFEELKLDLAGSRGRCTEIWNMYERERALRKELESRRENEQRP